MREYNYKVNAREDGGRRFWFCFQAGRVTYGDLGTALSLMKRSKLATAQSFPRPSKARAPSSSPRYPPLQAPSSLSLPRIRSCSAGCLVHVLLPGSGHHILWMHACLCVTPRHASLLVLGFLGHHRSQHLMTLVRACTSAVLRACIW